MKRDHRAARLRRAVPPDLQPATSGAWLHEMKHDGFA